MFLHSALQQGASHPELSPRSGAACPYRLLSSRNFELDVCPASCPDSSRKVARPPIIDPIMSILQATEVDPSSSDAGSYILVVLSVGKTQTTR